MVFRIKIKLLPVMEISKHFNVTNETDNCKKKKKNPPAKIYKYLKTTRGNPKIAFFFKFKHLLS